MFAMKRNDTPSLGSYRLLGPGDSRAPLGANYGATVRLLGPHVPDRVLHPVEELEPIRNPFLPPEATPKEQPVDAEFESPASPGRQSDWERTYGLRRARASTPTRDGDRDSEVWSNDTGLRRVPRNPPSGKMIAASFVVFAALGAGGFAALYTAVHSNDTANRARYAAEESRGTVIPATAELVAQPIAPASEPAAAPPTGAWPASATASYALPSTAAATTTTPPARIDSGAPVPNRIAVAAPAATVVHPAVFARAQAVPAARGEIEPERRGPVVVHVEPAPVPFLHHQTEDKDIPVSEDALLADPAQKAAESSQKPQAEATVPPSAAHDESAASSATPGVRTSDEPPPSPQSPDDPRK